MNDNYFLRFGIFFWLIDEFYKTESVLLKIGIIVAILLLLLGGLWFMLAAAEKKINL